MGIDQTKLQAQSEMVVKNKFARGMMTSKSQKGNPDRRQRREHKESTKKFDTPHAGTVSTYLKRESSIFSECGEEITNISVDSNQQQMTQLIKYKLFKEKLIVRKPLIATEVFIQWKRKFCAHK